MPDDSLAAQWARTRQHLDLAWSLLPSGSDDASEWFLDYRDHNELGLALDTLEQAGRDRSAGHDFWNALADAAASMGMYDQAADYRCRESN